MRSNRLMYDTCEYQTRLNESTGPLAYNLDPVRYENCNKCRYELGLLGGPNVSINSGNLVDVESDLSGRTRPLTECSANKYKPKCANPSAKCKTDTGIPYDCDECQPNKRHLRSCKFMNKPKVYQPERIVPEECGKRVGRRVGPSPNWGSKINNTGYITKRWQGQQGRKEVVYK